ncbi:MAG: UDP-N-acetyl-D-glucosamine dehydrogenase [candidate division Zixibacteria bacterium RBG_16_53_22]|nr:MAG: UDP-N-acetyl-D-glucosamine dehydrogenase [candidate division Zixibacteria bacterium RBG_16_53_22]
MSHGEQLRKKIEDRSAIIAVIGMGYVGLPLAVEFGRVGFKMVGIDILDKKVKTLNAGKSDVDDIKDYEVKELVDLKRLHATSDFTQLKKADVAIICVPTPLNKTKDPDVSFILAAVTEVAKYLHKGMLIVLESTTYPGTTDELLREKLEATGLKLGVDFFLAFSPERVDPGNPKFQTRNTPKIVGGTTPACLKVAKYFYEQVIIQVVPVSSTQTAEMVKLLENTFRSVNIGLVNEVALMCDRLGIDVWEVIDAAASKPFGFMPFYPGPGLGGHCIPIDPHYLSWKLKSLNYYARFIELAGDINSHMPEYVVDKITKALNTRRKSVNAADIIILGVAYKRDISDLRESPALDVIRLLQEKGAKVKYCDPYVSIIRMDNGPDLRATPLTEQLIKKADCVAIITDHSSFNYQWVVDKAQMVVDTRNATKNVTGKKKVFKL